MHICSYENLQYSALQISWNLPFFNGLKSPRVRPRPGALSHALSKSENLNQGLNIDTVTKLVGSIPQQKKGRHIHNMSSPHKIKHFTEVLDSNPGCETQCEDLPHSAKYPNNGIQKYAIFPKANRALIGARENEFLWYSSMSPMYMFWHPQLSIPPEAYIVIITATTPLKMLSARKVTDISSPGILYPWIQTALREDMEKKKDSGPNVVTFCWHIIRKERAANAHPSTLIQMKSDAKINLTKA
ncbi:hypothetical protein EV702DRAFT_1228505 [Suillus placidus]|uniref:Uncharacterized protein n=1 Tax=Suillus placidus TaxID=48579 RepID=A0A9P7D1H2_9AGAM|nr:hypothetical protein EV702DRAFT_1228505 [Suillus placidus]